LMCRSEMGRGLRLRLIFWWRCGPKCGKESSLRR
jgi:hypothetical protein